MKNIFFLLVTIAALTSTKNAAAGTSLNTNTPVTAMANISNDVCSIELPDMISDFSAVRSNDYAILTWVIQNQAHLDNFIIEKSNDNNNWSVCGTVPAHGDNTSPAVYFYGDAHPAATTYYRLKQVTTDGAAVYTDVAKVSAATKKAHNKK